MLENLNITHPKQKKAARTGFEAFYPYYAGYPQSFADALLESAGLGADSVVLDPWNGSGTTTKAAMQLGLNSVGYDINPAMVMIATARLLPRSEASCLTPLARELIEISKNLPLDDALDPLRQWLTPGSASRLRQIERAIAKTLMPAPSDKVASGLGTSRLVASLYLALFATARELIKPFRSSNPTWIRKAKCEDEKLSILDSAVHAEFIRQVEALALAYNSESAPSSIIPSTRLEVADSTSSQSENFADFILTSPPYCTRIDYAVATSIELAVISRLTTTDVTQLSKKMLGTPKITNEPKNEKYLGSLCEKFLKDVSSHESKASSTYYYKTHLDYYQKLNLSLENISKTLKANGRAVFVVQDSQYKNIHNDVPSIIAQMAEINGLKLFRRDDFAVKRNIVSINPKANFSAINRATESVLCFSKP